MKWKSDLQGIRIEAVYFARILHFLSMKKGGGSAKRSEFILAAASGSTHSGNTALQLLCFYRKGEHEMSIVHPCV